MVFSRQMKEIRIVEHLKKRLKDRALTRDLPKKIYHTAQERYLDQTTEKIVALQEIRTGDRRGTIALIYEETLESVTLITIHPIKSNQKENRIASGRWKRL